METLSTSRNMALLKTMWKRSSKTQGTLMSATRPAGPRFFGETTDGRYLIVVYERVDENTIYPVTAYEVPREGESWPNE